MAKAKARRTTTTRSPMPIPQEQTTPGKAIGGFHPRMFRIYFHETFVGSFDPKTRFGGEIRRAGRTTIPRIGSCVVVAKTTRTTTSSVWTLENIGEGQKQGKDSAGQ
jgi:hypothetical protein